MTIATLDQLLAGMQPSVEFFKAITPTLVAGKPQSLFYLGGIPGAAAAPSPGLAGTALTSYDGQLPFANPASGNAYLARLTASATVSGHLWLCDRLWHNSGFTITSTGAQTVNSATWPARDANGSSNGVGVLLGVEISTATSSGTPTITVGYTNSANSSGRTATNSFPTAASAAIGSFFPIGLQAGDVGVRSVQTLTLSATWTSGTMHLVAYRILAKLDLPTDLAGNSLDAVTAGLPRVFNDSVPFLVFVPSTTTASRIQGSLVMSHG